MRRYYLLLSFLLIWLGVIVPGFANSAFIERKEVQAFIQHMVTQYGFKRAPLTAIFSQVNIRPQIIEHIQQPLEEKASWRTYQILFVDEWRIKHGVEFWDKHAEALKRAEEMYHVPAGIIVATIGIESRFGQKIGGYRVLDSLANIAFSDTSRAKFFRQELIDFLLLTREQHMDPLKVMGSYAGAMGQSQFMPSSYRYFAIDFSHDGKIDLVHNETDVIGSIANYYHHYGWHMTEAVAVPATLLNTRYVDYFHQHPNRGLTLANFAKVGIVPKEKGLDPLLKAQLIELQSYYGKEYWLGFHNFRVIKRYNASDLYAMAVFQLSHTITSLRNQLNNG